MGLVTNQLDSLFNGVNQQAAEHRLPTQVEEMINAYPTLDKGLLKRNPTLQIPLTQGINYSDTMWSYAYDTGLGGNSSEQFSVNITEDGMEIININSGKVYNKGLGLTLEGESEEYMFPFVGINGYAATTVKDTTFIVNKNRTPLLDNLSGSSDETPIVKDYNYTLTPLVKTPSRLWTLDGLPYGNSPYRPELFQYNMAPTRGVQYGIDTPSGEETFDGEILTGSTTTVIIDGISIIVNVARITAGALDATSRDLIQPEDIETLDSYYSRLHDAIVNALDPQLYSVERASIYGTTSAFPPIRVTRWDEALTSMSVSIVFGDNSYPVGTDHFGGQLDSVQTDYIGATTNNIYSGSTVLPTVDFQKNGFIWVQSSNPTAGYTYSYTVLDTLGNSKSGTVTNTTTDGAATAIASAISADINFSAISVGSVVRITTDATGAFMERVDAGDSFGNQASFGWAKEVAKSQDLPKNLGFTGSLVKVIGTNDNAFTSYWLIYSNGQWRESIDPSSKTVLNQSSMPHILVRNSDDTFTLKPYARWDDKLVGDDITNPPQSFVSTVDNPTPRIKDLFFFKNRLGFITSNTVVMSEVGEYGNFWRTTVATILDSDPIDTSVDTTKAINLEYATYLEDSVLLFSDKAQFKLSGGNVLSPKSAQISQTSNYEINKNIRPLFMNDKVFFCAKRGRHTAVMQYGIRSTNVTSEAEDISAHIQSYIPSTVNRLSGSPINNMLFLSTSGTDGEVFVYKYLDSGGTRVQSAWFKWTFNGSIFNAFALSGKLNILIERTQAIAIADWVLGTGVWDNSKLWDNSKVWVMSADSLVGQKQFEALDIAPQDFTGEFFDASNTDKSVIIPALVGLGEWVYSSGKVKDIRGHLKFKTIQVSSEEQSQFSLLIEDIARGSSRTVASKNTVGRKPMVYGDSKNVRVSIVSNDEFGFRINTISYEGALTKRAKRS